jgi:putative ABC transport system permease protein
LFGHTLAAEEGLSVGNLLVLNHSSYKISGVMEETGGSEDTGIFAVIETARILTGIQNEWSLIEISSQNPAKTVLTATEALRKI